MSDSNIAVRITAEVVDLQSKFAIAKAEVNGLTSEMNKLAKASASGLIDAAGTARLQEVAGDMLHARQEAAELAKQMSEAGIAVGGFGNRAKEEASGIGGAFESMSGNVNAALQFTGIAIAIESVHKLAEVITESAQRANEIRNMSEVLGVTNTQFQAMEIAAEEAGIGTEQLFRGAEKLVLELDKARDGSGAAIEKIKQLGITNEDITNKTFGTAQMMALLSGRLNDAATKEETLKAISEVLGAKAVLAAGGIAELGKNVGHWSDKAREANALTDYQISRLHEIGAWWGMVGKSIENASAKLLVWAADAANAFIDANFGWMKGGGGDKGHAEGKIDRSGGSHGQAEAQQKVQAESKSINDQITKDTLDSIKDQIEATKQGSAERLVLIRQFYQDSLQYYGNAGVDKVKEAHRELVAEERAHGEELKRQAEKNAADLVATTREKASAIMAQENLSKAEQLAQVRDLYAQELLSATLTKDKRVEVQRSLNEAIAAVNREASATHQAIARSDAETDIAIARLSLEAEKQVLNEKLQLGKVSAAEKLADLRALTAEEFSLNEKELEQEISLLHQGTAEYERVYNEIRQLKAKLVVDLATLDRQGAADAAREAKNEAASWKASVAEIESAESTMLSSLLSGRQSFGQAALNLAGNLVTKEIQNDLKAMTTRLLLAKSEETQKTAIEQGGFLYHMLFSQKEVATAVASEAAKTSAVAGGVAARTAAEVSGAEAGKTAQAAMDSGSIQKDASKAAAGAYAAIAGIPYVGPFLAPAAAAVAYAGVMAFESMGLDQGAWEIPGTLRGVTLHKGESVVPQDFATGMRAAIAGGSGSAADTGGGGSTVIHNHNWNVSAMDGPSFNTFIRDKGGPIALVLKSFLKGSGY